MLFQRHILRPNPLESTLFFNKQIAAKYGYLLLNDPSMKQVVPIQAQFGEENFYKENYDEILLLIHEEQSKVQRYVDIRSGK